MSPSAATWKRPRVAFHPAGTLFSASASKFSSKAITGRALTRAVPFSSPSVATTKPPCEVFPDDNCSFPDEANLALEAVERPRCFFFSDQAPLRVESANFELLLPARREDDFTGGHLERGGHRRTRGSLLGRGGQRPRRPRRGFLRADRIEVGNSSASKRAHPPPPASR